MERSVMRALVAGLLSLSALSFASTSWALSAGDTAPVFKLPSFTDGTPVSPSDFRGKVLYVDFWASWCAPCLKAFPLMQRLRSELQAQGFEVVAVNVDEDVADARKFLKKQTVSFPVVGPAEDAVPTAYGVVGMPFGVVIDRQGRVRSLHAGMNEASLPALKLELQKLLAEPAKEPVNERVRPSPALSTGKAELLLFVNNN